MKLWRSTPVTQRNSFGRTRTSPAKERHSRRGLRSLGRRALTRASADAMLSTLPGLQFWAETPISCSMLHKFASQGFTDWKGAAISSLIAGEVGLGNFAVGRMANWLPALSEPEGGGEGNSPEQFFKGQLLTAKHVGALAVRSANTAVETVMKPLEWAGSAIQWTGNKLEDPTRSRFAQIFGRRLLNFSMATILGPSFAVIAEKEKTGQPVPSGRIAEMAAGLALAWIPLYDAVNETIHRGVYGGLNLLADQLEARKDYAASADVGQLDYLAHRLFDGAGDVLDIMKLPGQIAFSLLTASMAISALRRRPKKDEARLDGMNGESQEQTTSDSICATATLKDV